MRHSLTATILILALIAEFGCMSGRSDRISAPVEPPPPPGETIRSDLGKIAVTSGRFAPTFDIVDSPAKSTGAGAGGGAKTGAQIGLLTVYGGTFVLGPFAVLLIPLIAVGAGVGAIVGAATAEPAVKVEEREVAAASQVVAAQRIQDDFRDRVATVGRDQTAHTFTVLTDRGPSGVSERPDYRPLSQEGIQTVLEVVVMRLVLEGRGAIDPPVDLKTGRPIENPFALEGPGAVNPPLRLVMTVNTRLVRTVDNAEIYAHSLTYSGEKNRPLTEWVGGSEAFQDELNRAYPILAYRTVKEVFFPARWL